MNFSENMLIDFARAVKTDDKKSDVTLLGEVMGLVDAQTAAVRLDGSNENTLCQIAAVVDVGDRVTVLIKDHKAILTGNISNPASANDESKFIRIDSQGNFVIGTIDEHGDPRGFYIHSTGTNYEIKDRSGNTILEVTSSAVKVFNHDVITNATDVLTTSDVDDQLSSTSENPVQNKVIYNALNTSGLVPMKKAVVYDAVTTLNTGDNTITFSLPVDFVESYGASIVWAWPMSTWTGAGLTIVRDDTVLSGTGSVVVYSGTTQDYRLSLLLAYK